MTSRAERKKANLAKAGPSSPSPKKSAARAVRPAATQEPQAESPNLAAVARKKAGEKPGDRVIEASFLAGATTREQFPPPAIAEIAFAGRSNVGKSSLMNSLAQRRNLVRTSSTLGCTCQVAWFRTVSDDKCIVDLIDLPGYGYAKRSKSERNHWANLIGDYLLGRVTLRGVVLLIDVRRGVEEDDLELIKMLTDEPQVSRPELELVIVATKLDKLAPAAQKTALAQMSKAVGRPVLGYSAHADMGRTTLWRTVRRIAGVGLVETAREAS